MTALERQSYAKRRARGVESDDLDGGEVGDKGGDELGLELVRVRMVSLLRHC